MSRSFNRTAASIIVGFTWVLVTPADGSGQTTIPPLSGLQQPTASPAPASRTSLTLGFRDTLRVESWRFFDPEPGGGDPDYGFLGNRLLLDMRFVSPRVDVTAAAQWVGLVNLPPTSVGPGALGTGPLYYAQGGQHENLQEFYLKYASIRVKKLLPGFDVQFGRQTYASGAEAASGDAKIEAVKRQRLDARLIGEFEWSLFQRSFDGLRLEWSNTAVKATGIAVMPTQGGFARDAGKTLTDIWVYGGAVNLLPGKPVQRTEFQAFVWRYEDSRPVTGRPDNTGRTAAAADVGITTFGGTAVGAYPAGSGQVDLLGWLALQDGHWYDHDHGALSLAAEAGYQWTRARWAPWIRGGVSYASGDDNPADGEHGTFFPMLPTMRRYSQTTVNSTMNLSDLFVLAVFRPSAASNIRIDWHRLWLAQAADRWYSGSGATLESGANFGYVTRPSNESTDFGTSIEVSAAYTVNKYWSVNGFVGRMWGGPVVTGTFAGDDLWFAYFENVVPVGR